jgi:hypothetical protein
MFYEKKALLTQGCTKEFETQKKVNHSVRNQDEGSYFSV